MGHYLFNVLGTYQKSCDDADGQLFIPRQHIESIRKLLQAISLLSKAIAAKVHRNSFPGEPVQLSTRIDNLLEQTKDTQWPINAPVGYDPNDIRWPGPVKDPSAKDEPLAPRTNNQGHSGLAKIILVIATVMIVTYLSLGRRCKNSYLAQGSSASPNLLKGR